jgi:hypothetical protein
MATQRKSRTPLPTSKRVRHAAWALAVTLALLSCGCGRTEVTLKPITVEPIVIRVEVTVREPGLLQPNSSGALEGPTASTDPNIPPTSWRTTERSQTNG